MEKDNYILLRDKFLGKKEKIMEKIQKNEEIIKQKNRANSDLEETMKNSIVRIKECDRDIICGNCEIYSMKQNNIINGSYKKVYVYNCVICGYEDIKWN